MLVRRVDAPSQHAMSDPTLFCADLRSPGSPLRQPWQWCVGSGHATLALRADWQAQLRQAHGDLGFRHVRFHGILDDDMGTLIMQDGQLLYSFFNTDRIFDFLLSIGMKPLVELSFMPRALSSGGDVVFHYQGNITPPRDYAQWGELVRRLADHWVDRYGIEEVSLWPFECWNEPNLSPFWTGDQAAYFELYRTTAQAIKSVDPRLRVGGPATAANAWIDEFLAYCGKTRAPVDFVSTHHYPTDPFGAVDVDAIAQLEHSPPGVMRARATEARASSGALPLYYTEWSISSNPRDPLRDSAFAAAFAARIAMSVDDLVDGYSYWTFSDIFEESHFPSVPFHGGFGMLNLYGIPKPVYRAFQMLRGLGDEQVATSGEHANVAIWVGRWAGGPDRSARVLLINQAMPGHAIGSESVRVRLLHPPAMRPRATTVARLDADHANPERTWREMGSPTYLKPAQVETLVAASRTAPEVLPFRRGEGALEFDLVLAPQSVNSVHIEWQPR
jgi:xylan 1,4-beta-xylosidase